MGKARPESDAIRHYFRHAVIRCYGNVRAGAEAIGLPYKTLYRALTPDGKDHVEDIDLSTAVRIANALERDANCGSFPVQYERALREFTGTRQP